MTHGHCHPPIVRAIQEQAGKLDQIIFAGFAHDPAEDVAARLLRLAPRGLTMYSLPIVAQLVWKWP